MKRAVILAFTLFFASAIPAAAQSIPQGYTEAEDVFDQLSVASRVKMQVILTAAGHWPAVPNTTFSTRLFQAIASFQADHGFPRTGYLSPDQLDAAIDEAAPYLMTWGFEDVRHPKRPTSIWVPMGLKPSVERTKTGLSFADAKDRMMLTFNYYDGASISEEYEGMINALNKRGFKIHYSAGKRDFYAVSYTATDGRDGYVRYQQDRNGIVGFHLSWDNAKGDIGGERLATIISGSLLASATGAPFPQPFSAAPATKEPAPPASSGSGLSPEASMAPRSQPAPKAAPPKASPPPAVEEEEPEEEPVKPQSARSQPQPPAQPEQGGTVSSGTGFFVNSSGYLLTNAHVVEKCNAYEVTPNGEATANAKLIAKDSSNDLALLKINTTPPAVAPIRISAKLGEPVAVFGFPLANMLSRNGNFTLGNVTALAGLGDDTAHLQISAPVQSGNSGGPLLDSYGNLVGVVRAKLNAMKVAEANGDLPQNVNFAIKSAVAINFLSSNNVSYTDGQATGETLTPVALAEKAKSVSAFVLCK